MPNPFRDLFFGRRNLVEAVEPRRTFDDVVLPPATVRQLNHALAQILHHDLIFRDWGLAERHDSGLGLAFNFAGPPGTGKTICAEAIAHTLHMRLLVVRYDEMQSMWAGETGRNVAAVFRAAEEQGAVLFFDEADAIAGRRFTAVDQGYQRESNAVVNVLLKEVEQFAGVVIFATNLASNFDPAFERRIRTHILFEMPGVEERAEIWRVQIHPQKTPLANDVDFRVLAEQFPASGGDIKNAVLKAAQVAAAEPAGNGRKAIHQRHFQAAMREVLSARRVMDQSVFGGGGAAAEAALAPLTRVAEEQAALEANLVELAQRLVVLEDHSPVWERRLKEVTGELADQRVQITRQADTAAADRVRYRDAWAPLDRRSWIALGVAALAALLAAGAFLAALFR